MALDQLEITLKKQWRLGQSILLCWAFDPNGLLTIVVPHYFLGNFTSPNHPSGVGEQNEDFVRDLISGRRFKAHNEIFEIARKLGVAPSFVKLDQALTQDDETVDQIDSMIKRYSLGHEESRAVVVFDIADFLCHSCDELLDMSGIRVDEGRLTKIHFEPWSAGQPDERLIEVAEKHGLSQSAHNVGFTPELEGRTLSLGVRNR